MADGEKRIVELTETQTFGNGDYLPLDNISNSETKKIEAKKLGITYTMTDTEDGFSFDGSNGYHYEKVIPKDAQMSYEDYDDLTEEEKMDGSNRFIPDFPEEVKESEIWTRVGRTPLTTDAKTVSPAINELKGRIDDSDDEITEIKSNLTNLTTYSTTEKIVGYWTDGTTPIYEKSFEFTNELVLPQNTWVSIGESASIYSKILGCWGTSSLGVFWGFLSCSCDSTNVSIQSLRSSQIGVKYLTLRYIKSS